MSNFWYQRYTTPPSPIINEPGAVPPALSSDHSDAYANNGFVISFFHMITCKNLRFKAFLTAINETYTPDYASESVFGRMDPIHIYKGTTRQITLAFKIPAASMSEAYENLAKVQTLIQMQYPAYTNIKDALTIAQAPLVRLKVMNIIKNANISTQNTTGGTMELYDSYKSEDNPENGLLGVITSLTIDHQLTNDDVGVLEKAQNTILPKLIEVNLNFAPLHEHTGGWFVGDSSFNFAGEGESVNFPYGASEYQNDGCSPDIQSPTGQTEDDIQPIDAPNDSSTGTFDGEIAESDKIRYPTE